VGKSVRKRKNIFVNTPSVRKKRSPKKREEKVCERGSKSWGKLCSLEENVAVLKPMDKVGTKNAALGREKKKKKKTNNR